MSRGFFNKYRLDQLKSNLKKIKVLKIFRTLHGEMPYQGKPVTVVRLKGCLSRCAYCDTKGSWDMRGRGSTVAQVMRKISEKGLKEVLVTGGEPLCQEPSKALINGLIGRGYQVSLETDGSYPLSGIDKRVTLIMDLKTPGSRSSRKTILSNLKMLNRKDVLKVVITGKRDYEWAKRILARMKREIRCQVVFSPVYGKLKASTLAGYLIRDRSRYRMQIQLHKVLGIE